MISDGPFAFFRTETPGVWIGAYSGPLPAALTDEPASWLLGQLRLDDRCGLPFHGRYYPLVSIVG